MTGWWTAVENWRPREEQVLVSACQFPTAAHRPWKTQTRRFPHSHSADGVFYLSRGHFYRVKEGDILIELAHSAFSGLSD